MNDRSKRPLRAVPEPERSGAQPKAVQAKAANPEPEQLQLSLPLPQLIDIPTLAARLGTTTRHIRRQIADKKIPYLKVGHLVRFDVYEIAEWLKARRFSPDAPRTVASGQ